MHRNQVDFEFGMAAGAKPAAFVALAGPFGEVHQGKDSTRVFYRDSPLDVADPGLFEVVSDLYDHNAEWACDGKHYYYRGTRIDGADYDSFRLTSGFSAEDNLRSYTPETQ